MKLRSATLLCLLLLQNANASTPCKKKVQDSFKFAFWNLENACDTIDDPYSDDDFTPAGAMQWNTEKYMLKLQNLSKVIDLLQADVYGFCEIEKPEVLQAIFNTGNLQAKPYRIVQYNSPDERGIDVGFAYDSVKFNLIYSEAIPVKLTDDKTRDILYVKLFHKTQKEYIHFFINHFPSRRQGQEISAPKRAAAAQTLYQYLRHHNLENTSVIIAGDFNDSPQDSSMAKLLGAAKPESTNTSLYNLSLFFNAPAERTLGGPKNGSVFDQIVISKNLWYGNNGITFKRYSCRIFAPAWLKQGEGKFEGYPFRTFGGKTWLKGYSDHFPVTASFRFGKGK